MRLDPPAARCLVLAALLLACGESGIVTPAGDEPPAGSRIIVGPARPVLTPGLTQQMLAVIQDAAGEPIDALQARWGSSDPAVASVTASGLVTANRAGITMLTAASGSVRAQSQLTVQSAPVTTPSLLEHRDVVATIFWVGEGADASNQFISNAQSAFDRSWLAHYGGVDAPQPRRGYLPAGFTPLENPFYFALPYSDLDDDGARKQNAPLVIPWASSRAFGSAESMVKNRWLRVTSRRTGITCYAQWEDAGPGVYDDFQYVFGSTAPANPFLLAGLTTSSALDLSPAVRDCLGHTDDVMRLDWQFVADADVPPGPWKDIVTRSQGTRSVGLTWRSLRAR
jgi:hypothetical protein